MPLIMHQISSPLQSEADKFHSVSQTIQDMLAPNAKARAPNEDI